MSLLERFKREGFFRAFVIITGMELIVSYFLFVIDYASAKPAPIFFNLFFLGLFILFYLFIIGWWLFQAYLPKRKALKNFRESECEFIEYKVDLNNTSFLFDLPSRIAVCEGPSQKTGKTIKFRSNQFWFVPGKQAVKGMKLKIYFNPNNIDEYYINTDPLF